MPIQIDSHEFLTSREAAALGEISIDQLKHRVYRTHAIPVARYFNGSALFRAEDILRESDTDNRCRGGKRENRLRRTSCRD